MNKSQYSGRQKSWFRSENKNKTKSIITVSLKLQFKILSDMLELDRYDANSGTFTLSH